MRDAEATALEDPEAVDATVDDGEDAAYVARLGPWSSHPHALRRLSRRVRWFVLGPLIGIYVVVAYLWLRSIDGTSLAADVLGFLEGAAIVGLLLGVAAFASLLALSLDVRIALHNGGDPEIGRAGLGRDLSAGAWIGIATGVLLFSVLVVRATFLPVELRVLGGALPLVPFLVLHFVTAPAGEVRFPRFALLVLSPLCLLAIVASGWLVEQLGAAPQWLLLNFPLLASVSAVRSLATFLLGCSLLWSGAALLARLSGGPADAAAAPEPAPPAPEPEDDPAPDSTVRDGIASLLEGLAAREGWSSELRRLDGGHDDSPAAPPALLQTLFGCVPTRGQLEAFDAFSGQLDALIAPRAPACVSATLVLEGGAGSGRSRVLEAQALAAAVRDGLSVMLVCLDRAQTERAAVRLVEVLASLDLGDAVCVEGMEDAGLARAARLDPASSPARPVPDEESAEPGRGETELDARPTIRLRTHDWFLEGYGSGPGAALAPFARALERSDVLLLDDVDRLPTPRLVHQPYVLDALRLVARSHGRALAVVVVLCRMSEIGRHVMRDALTEPQVFEDHLFAVRQLGRLPGLVADYWDVAVEGSTQDALQALCRHTGDAALPTFVWYPEIDREEALVMAESLRENDSGRAVEVVTDLEALDPRALERGLFVVVGRLHMRGLGSLASRLRGSDVAMLRLRRALDELAPDAWTPLWSPRRAGILALQHLCRAALLLARARPLAVDGNPLLVALVEEIGYTPRVDEVDDLHHVTSFDLDLLTRSEGRDSDGSMALLLERSEAVPFDSLRLQVDEPVAVLPPEQQASRLQRRALQAYRAPELLARLVWEDANALLIGRQDGKYLRTLLWEGETAFAPQHMLQEADGGQLRVRAQRYRGDDIDAIHPRFHFRLVPGFDRALVESVTPGRGIIDGGIFELAFDGDLAVTVTAELVERATGTGRVMPCTARFDYEARIKVILVDVAPQPWVTEGDGSTDGAQGDKGLRECVLDYLSARTGWSSREEGFRPAATAALSSAMDAVLSEATAMARLLAFEADGALAGACEGVLLVLEPAETFPTVAEALLRSFEDPPTRKALAEAVDSVFSSQKFAWDRLDPRRVWIPGDSRHPADSYAGEDDGQRFDIYPEYELIPAWKRITHAERQSRPDPELRMASLERFLKERRESWPPGVADALLGTGEASPGARFEPPAHLPRGAPCLELAIKLWNILDKRMKHRHDHEVHGVADHWQSLADPLITSDGDKDLFDDCDGYALTMCDLLTRYGFEDVSLVLVGIHSLNKHLDHATCWWLDRSSGVTYIFDNAWPTPPAPPTVGIEATVRAMKCQPSRRGHHGDPGWRPYLVNRVPLRCDGWERFE